MSAEAFNWTILLCAWFALFGLGACALAVYEWHLRRRNRDLLPPPGGRARIYRADPPAPISRWGSTR
jgi:hypothetical protein